MKPRSIGVIDSIHIGVKDLDSPGDAMRQAVSEKASGAMVGGTPLYSSLQRKRIVDFEFEGVIPYVRRRREAK